MVISQPVTEIVLFYHTRSLEKKGFPVVIFLTRLPAWQA